MKRTVLPSISVAFLALLFFVGLFAVSANDAYAIPAWARKYKTSCATCHYAFPKLNAFGRAFQYNGFQFPGGPEVDKENTKEKPVSMGSEAYKRVWPDAIWPNSLPASIPMSAVVESEIAYDPNAPAGEPDITFDEIPSEFEVLSGGNFSDNISFFAELAIEGGEVDLEMASVGFDNIIPNNGLSLKVGKIVPFLSPFSNMRRLTEKYLYATSSLGNNAWNFDRTQRGFEVRGLLGENKRLAYSAGLVEGRNNEANGSKDVYIHAGYKFGGLRLDGVQETTGAGPSQPWQDNSIRLDAFFYSGRATLSGGQKDDFNQFGATVDAYYNRLNLSALLTVQNDDSPVIGSTFDGTGTHFMTEANYVLYPWLLPSLRYERFKATLGSASETEQRFVPGVVAMVRANVKILLQALIEKPDGGSYDLGEVEAALSIGF